MAVAGEDAGITLVSFRCSRAAHPQHPRTRDPAPKPPRPPSSETRRSRSSGGRRSLSRLLGRCAESEEEEEQQTAQHQEQQEQQKQRRQQLASHRLSGVPAELPDSPELSVDKIKLVGFKRSHSFCVQPKKSKNVSSRSSSNTRPGKENGPWPYESQTLKTSREVKMERERLRQARGETLWADKDDVFSSFIRQNQERFNTLLEERGFTHIPPPAGFGAPTRPSSLLAALSCGPTSLDEGSLSGAARRRTTYTIRRSATAGFTTTTTTTTSTTTNTKENGNAEPEGVADGEDSPQHSAVKEKDEEEEEEPWCDLPSSPLSPPSPFHHPFFRHQLGLPTPVADPWARFSGFGMPRLPQVLLAHAQAQQEAAAARKEEWNRAREEEGSAGEDEEEDGEEQVRRRHPLSRGAGRGQYCVTSRHSVVRYCSSTNSYKVCTEAKYINDSFGDGVSESESEDEEDISPAPVSAPAPTPTRQRPATPSRTSRPHSPLSDMDTESKRNSQAVSTEPSDLEDHSSVTTSDIECPEPPVVDSRKDKAYRIALELLHTERTYVKVLHLIDQEFQFRVDNENRAHHMFPPDVILHMFSNIKSIYKLHHDFLLPQLEERMAQWEHNRRIGDIMKNFAPFLKMYTEYVRNFDNAMTLINQWQAKCPRFAAIMDDIHSMEVCGNLTLQHHMLSPVQRIPRYEMLLRDYLKKLPEDSPDCHDTEKALHLVSTAANHANDAMKKIDKFEKLLEIQESLGGAEDLVSPTRELIKEGKIIKISARSGDHQERYIFLLTDLLLLCSPKLMSGRVMSGPQYRLRAKYHVENLIIQEGDNLETANTFYIKDNNKSVELYTQTIEEKEQWLDAFIRAIHETSQRKSSLKLHFNPNQRVIDVDLGQKQPMLIRSDSVTKCMECGSQFTMVRRKHHCRACGAVVCSKCSSFKASLAYECGKSVRVCRTCHATLQELSSSTATPSPEIDDGDECSVYSAKDQLDLPFRNRGVLEVSAKTSGAVMQGFLQLKTHRKTWVKRWFALHTDFVLYSFKCEADDQALTATPVPGFTVTHLQGTRNESGISDKEKERAFKLHHAKKQYIFQAASKDESQRWVAALKKASQAELPSPVQ
ncbi:FYVE, RhoGEF and PH domain-containing protein 4-like isoform X3 [Portunus trituberculatus]|uniref:FYVE, RhoGEF and PH domain-containing protein 4-like isoform X3 n=1 Tax=Portunus trituberculatus TaxID=210409 RepID=UPI001E1CB5B4|nr:FYVE, RhoGEF and PH domain-containing protein 4-like isoform X3 [Portunus trituberculatus]